MKNLFFTVKNCIQNIEAFLNDYLNKAGSVVTVPYLAYVNWGIHLARTADVDNAVEKLETAVLMNPSSVSAHMNLGIVFLQKEQYEKALKEFLTSIDLDEENAHAYSLAATVFVYLNEFKTGESYFKKAVKMNEYLPEIYLNYASALAAKGKKDKAADMYNLALRYDPGNFYAVFCLGVLYYNSGRFEQAGEKLTYALNLDENNPEALYYAGLCAYNLGNMPAALFYAQKALRFVETKNLVVLKAESLMMMDNEAESLTCFESYSKKYENDLSFLAAWGNALQKFGRLEQAGEKLTAAFEINPDDEKTLMLSAQNRMKRGDLKTAAILLKKVIKNNPKNAEATGTLGKVLYTEGNSGEAIEYLKKAVKMSGKSGVFYPYLAKACFNVGDLTSAEFYYMKATEYNSEDVASYVAYAGLLLQSDKPEEALRKIRTAYKLSPDSIDVNRLYVAILMKLKMYPEALLKLDKIISFAPDFYEAIFTKVEVLNYLGRPQDAVKLVSSLPEEIKDTKDFLYNAMISYKNLAQKMPSRYNVDVAMQYCDRLTDKYSREYKTDGIRQELEEISKLTER